METSRSRAATVPLVGGLAVLDLINTVSWRGAPSRSEDHLRHADDCLVWSARVGVLAEPEVESLRSRLGSGRPGADAFTTSLRELREVAADVVLDPSETSLAAARNAILDAFAHSRLEPASSAPGGPEPYAWRVTDLDKLTVSRRLSLQLHTLLTSPGQHVGICADADCRWVFLDTSRGHNRQWCDSRDCGNRHRVRQHQLRARAQRSE